jgi:hypothetical protein
MGAALVYIQDTETDQYGELTDPGRYEIYGTSSLDFPNFTWISNLGNTGTFTEATLPSVAVNGADPTRASVTYLAGEYQTTEWQAWATLWDMPNSWVSDPTSVDINAQGAFVLDSFLVHDWGTASSIAMFDMTSDNYWACWSDRMDSIEPGYVRGALGFANP